MNQTQNERIKAKLARDGAITRNQCLSQYPAITRLGARIGDLEKEGYVFNAERREGDYVYTLLSVNGVPFEKQKRADHLRIATDAVRGFEDYQSTTKV